MGGIAGTPDIRGEQMMLNFVIHFASGMALTTLLFSPLIIKDIILGKRTARLISKMIIGSYLLGLFAMTPNVLRMLGVPPSVYTHPLMNIFLLHPLVESSLKVHGGMLIGSVLFMCSSTAQYVLILFALIISKSRHFFAQ